MVIFDKTVEAGKSVDDVLNELSKPETTEVEQKQPVEPVSDVDSAVSSEQSDSVETVEATEEASITDESSDVEGVEASTPGSPVEENPADSLSSFD